MEVKYVAGKGKPHIDDNTISIYNENSANYAAIHTDRWVAVHCLPNAWFFFVGGKEVGWNELCDSQRLALRVRTRNWAEVCRPNGGYNDDRYYILEGLEAA